MTPSPVMTLLGDAPALAAILEECAGGGRFSWRAKGEAAEADILLLAGKPEEMAPLAAAARGRKPAQMQVFISAKDMAVEGEENATTLFFHTPLRLAAFLEDVLNGYRLARLYEKREIAPGLFFIPAARSLEDVKTARALTLSEKEAGFLSALLEAGGEGLARATAMTQVWGYHAEADSHAVETTVSRLRQKLREELGLAEALVSENGAYRWKLPL